MLINLKKSRLLYLLSALFLQGCSPDEEELWGLGSFVFSVFIIIVVLNTVVPTIQEYETIKRWLEYFQKVIQKGFIYLIVISLILIVLGLYSILSSSERSSENLIFYIGVLFLYLSINMRNWSVEMDKHKKRNYVRVMGLSISFMFLMVYLMIGAPNLSL